MPQKGKSFHSAFVLDGTKGSITENPELIEKVCQMLEQNGYAVVGLPAPKDSDLSTNKAQTKILMEQSMEASKEWLTAFDKTEICMFVLFGQPKVEASFLLGRASKNNQRIYILWIDGPVTNAVADIGYGAIYQLAKDSGGGVITRNFDELYKLIPNAG